MSVHIEVYQKQQLLLALHTPEVHSTVSWLETAQLINCYSIVAYIIPPFNFGQVKSQPHQ